MASATTPGPDYTRSRDVRHGAATGGGAATASYSQLTGLDLTCLAAKTVPGQVRTLVRLRLLEWGLPGLVDDACLVAAELVTNACEATPEKPIRTRFTRDAHGVVLAVWDSSDRLPQAAPIVELELDDLDLSEENLDRNGGRGLPLVQALATDYGTRKTNPHGKWTWARLTP